MPEIIRHTFEEGEFEGKEYYAPKFVSIEDATSILGEENILSMLNAQVLSRIRAKVKNKEWDELPQVLFSEEEARNWRPERSGVTPAKLYKEARAALASGDKERAKELLQKMAALMGV